MAYNPRDPFYLSAKKEGFRSRAAYKLLELNRRYGVIRPGDRVVDLGAAPGGWLQVAAQLATGRGKVLGVDLQPIEPFQEENIITLQEDITSDETQRRIKELLGALADCVLSDLSPRLSGIHDADVARSIALARSALQVARRLLRPGGNFLVKSFVGEEVGAFSAELREHFRSLQRSRPEATRKASSEIYFCAKGFQVTSQPMESERDDG